MRVGAPYIDIEAVEELFGTKEGSYSFGMGITKEDDLTSNCERKNESNVETSPMRPGTTRHYIDSRVNSPLRS